MSPYGELDETSVSCSILAHWLYYVETWRHSQNRKCISYCRTQPRPQVTCTEHFVKFRHVVFEVCERTDTRQTDRHTDLLIAILAPIPDRNNHDSVAALHHGAPGHMILLNSLRADCRLGCASKQAQDAARAVLNDHMTCTHNDVRFPACVDGLSPPLSWFTLK